MKPEDPRLYKHKIKGAIPIPAKRLASELRKAYFGGMVYT